MLITVTMTAIVVIAPDASASSPGNRQVQTYRADYRCITQLHYHFKRSVPVKYHTRVDGWLRIYTKRLRHGWTGYCAVNLASARTMGKRLYRDVFTMSDYPKLVFSSSDQGYYRHYAGPITFKVRQDRPWDLSATVYPKGVDISCWAGLDCGRYATADVPLS